MNTEINDDIYLAYIKGIAKGVGKINAATLALGAEKPQSKGDAHKLLNRFGHFASSTPERKVMLAEANVERTRKALNSYEQKLQIAQQEMTNASQ